jgi:hypothetical protein
MLRSLLFIFLIFGKKKKKKNVRNDMMNGKKPRETQTGEGGRERERQRKKKTRNKGKKKKRKTKKNKQNRKFTRSVMNFVYEEWLITFKVHTGNL